MGDRLNYIVGLSAACVEKENTVSCVQAHKRTKNRFTLLFAHC